MPAGRPKILQRKKRAFLAHYKECGIICAAARAAGIVRRTHYDWLRDDPDYAIAFRDAEKDAGDALEERARHLAINGWEEPIFHDGEVVGAKQKYSAALLIFLLKGAKPEKYRERLEHTGAGGGPLQFAAVGQEQARAALLAEPGFLEYREQQLLGAADDGTTIDDGTALDVAALDGEEVDGE